MRHLLTFLLATIALTAGVAQAREISPDDAIDEVGRFARGRRNSKRGRGPSGEARTYSVDGTNLFHMVALEGGGFVAVAGEDTDDAPSILGFSESGEFPELDVNSPLWALLCGDTAKRRGMNPRRAMRKKPHIKKHDKPRKKNATLLASSSALLAASADNPVTIDSMIDDMRVPPLVKSKWSQRVLTVSDSNTYYINDEYPSGRNLYNYYTPNNYVCGCVATAMAQLMRYHKYPKTAVNADTYTCYVDKSPTNLTMIGGVYDWDSMPLMPEFSSITSNQCEQIGKICYDAGVAMRMQYALDASSAYTDAIFQVLKEIFGYENAESQEVDEYNLNDTIRNGILANLDAGFPVLLGISRCVAKDHYVDGHAIIADGYGYKDGDLYCHLNMGWSGYQDYWYNIPYMPTDPCKFNAINVVAYNIFPNQTGQLATGRIVDPYGNPVSNAIVNAKISYKDSVILTNVATSAYGIYAIMTPSNVESRISITGVYDFTNNIEWVSDSLLTNTVASISPRELEFVEDGLDGYWDTSIGNTWGNDLVVVPTNIVAASMSTFSLPDAGAEGYANIAFSGTAGARYQLEWTDALTNQVWNVYTNILLNVNGADTIPIMLDPASPSRFYRLSTSTWK